MLIDFKTYFTLAVNRSLQFKPDLSRLYVHTTKELAVMLNSLIKDPRIHTNHKLWPHVGKLFLYSILEASQQEHWQDDTFRTSYDCLASNNSFDKFSAIDCLEACIVDAITYSEIHVESIFEILSHLGFSIRDVRAYSDMVLRLNEREFLTNIKGEDENAANEQDLPSCLPTVHKAPEKRGSTKLEDSVILF